MENLPIPRPESRAQGYAVDYRRYLKSARWRSKCRMAMDRAGKRCQLCASRARLNVHHNTYARLGDELPYDLVVLCHRCHAVFHVQCDPPTAAKILAKRPALAEMKPETPAKPAGVMLVTRPEPDRFEVADADARVRPVELSAAVADLRPLDDPGEFTGKDYQHFVGVAASLQRSAGESPITLPCGRLSEVMGIAKMTVSRYRRWAVEDGFAVVTKLHGRTPGDATEFRFDVSGWNKVAEKAEGGTTATFANLRPMPANEQ